MEQNLAGRSRNRGLGAMVWQSIGLVVWRSCLPASGFLLFSEQFLSAVPKDKPEVDHVLDGGPTMLFNQIGK